METYSSDTSYIIRHDFMRFSTDVRTTKGLKTKKKINPKKRFEIGLEVTRDEMAHDDGRGTLGRYKCPIF